MKLSCVYVLVLRSFRKEHSPDTVVLTGPNPGGDTSQVKYMTRRAGGRQEERESGALAERIG